MKETKVHYEKNRCLHQEKNPIVMKKATYATKCINKSKASFVKIIVYTMNNFKYELKSVFKKSFVLTN